MGASRRKASQSAVTAIAIGRVFGVLAIAEPDLFPFLKGELLWTHPGTFVAAVTEWLVTGKTAGAPEMIAGGKFNGAGFGIVDFGEIAHGLKRNRDHPGMQGDATSAASAPRETGSPSRFALKGRTGSSFSPCLGRSAAFSANAASSLPGPTAASASMPGKKPSPQ